MSGPRTLALALLILIAAFPALPEGLPTTIAAGQVLRGNFVQERILAGFDAPLRSEGRFVLAPAHGLIWRTEVPFPITTVISPTGLVQYTGGTEILRLSASRMPFLLRIYELLGSVLAGDRSALGERFVVRQSTEGGRWRIDLTPRESSAPGMPFETVIIFGTHFAEEIEIRKPRGDLDRLRFTGQVLSSGPLSPDETGVLSGNPK